MRRKVTALPLFALLPAAFTYGNTATFDHSDPKVGIAYVNAEPGEFIQVTIESTCEDFTETVRGVTGQQPDTTRLKKNQPVCGGKTYTDVCVSTTKQFTIPHDGVYDGYQINYRSDAGQMSAVSSTVLKDKCGPAATKPGHIDNELTPLENRVYMVVVNDSPWVIEFSGGLAVSSLTDPQYYVKEVPGTDTIPAYSEVARDRSAEDDHDLMFTAFAHARNKNCRMHKLGSFCKNLSISAGFGTESGEDLDYFLGVSYKMGPAFLTFGYHWGQVNRLKTGVDIGTRIDGTNVTKDVVAETNLAKRTEESTFIALTYSFGGNAKSKFMKNIAPASVP